MIGTISVPDDAGAGRCGMAGLTFQRPMAVAALEQGGGGNEHDRASRRRLLERIGHYLDVPVLDMAADTDPHAGRSVLLVPDDTLMRRPGGRGDEPLAAADVFGGIVPAAFVATKAITHGLIDEAAVRPDGWSTTMAALLGGAALDGYTAFSHGDARRAGRRLLQRGPVRIKDVCAKAGLGQIVVHDADTLDRVLDTQDSDAIAEWGIVLEENMVDVVTYSVGSVTLGDDTVSYWGSQNLTTDGAGREVYGGSDLCVVRGGFPALHELDLPPHLVRAVACAAAFDAAAHAAYSDIRLSRINYDVIEGTDAAGARRIGVLEQSWRVGGASGAEIAALEALRADPDLRSVRCSTVEVYELVTPPAGATLYYRGIDPVVGPMTKYAMRLA